MTFKIHYDGKYQDEIYISGETIDDIKAQAMHECEKRGWESKNCCSEKIE